MGEFTHSDLEDLVAHQVPWCVSIYCPPHHTWADNQAKRIRFGNQVKDATQRLLALGMRGKEARELLEPARLLGEDLTFWHEPRGDSVASFVASGYLRHFRLPVPFEELLIVAERFAIKPLLPLLSAETRFYVLALAQKGGVRLFRCTRQAAQEIVLPQLPKSVDEATGFDEPERGHQRHAGPPVGSGGERVPVIHTIGIRADDTKEDIFEFSRAIDRRLTRFLQGQTVPLVLAGVDYLLPIYRRANTYPHLMERGVVGSPEQYSAEQLRKLALPIVEAELHRATEAAVARYRQTIGTGGAASGLEPVLHAAHAGLVGTLLVSQRAAVWGRFDAASGRVEVHERALPGDEDLTDTAAQCTLLHRGIVLVLPPQEMPGDEPVAALLRYEVALSTEPT